MQAAIFLPMQHSHDNSYQQEDIQGLLHDFEQRSLAYVAQNLSTLFVAGTVTRELFRLDGSRVITLTDVAGGEIEVAGFFQEPAGELLHGLILLEIELSEGNAPHELVTYERILRDEPPSELAQSKLLAASALCAIDELKQKAILQESGLNPEEVLLFTGRVDTQSTQDGVTTLLVEVDGNQVATLSVHVPPNRSVDFVGRTMVFIIEKDCPEVDGAVPLLHFDYIDNQGGDRKGGLKLDLSKIHQTFSLPGLEVARSVLMSGLMSFRDEWPSSATTLGLEPREYLKDWLDAYIDWLRLPRDTDEAKLYASSLIGATGTGKSEFAKIVIASFVKESERLGGLQVLVLTSSRYLIRQLAETFEPLGFKMSHASSQDFPLVTRGSDGIIHFLTHCGADISHPETENGVTALRRALRPSLVIVDEADEVTRPGSFRYLEGLKDQAVVLSLTATSETIKTALQNPEDAIGVFYDEVTNDLRFLTRTIETFFGRPFAELRLGDAITRGILPAPSLRQYPIDLLRTDLTRNTDSDSHRVLGPEWDLVQESVYRLLTDESTRDEYSYINSRGERRLRSFAVRVSCQERAEELAKYLTRRGIPTATLISTTSPVEREISRDELNSDTGDIVGIVGVNAIARGVNIARLGVLIDCYPTSNVSETVQLIGRINRATKQRGIFRPPSLIQIIPVDPVNMVFHAEALRYAGTPPETVKSLQQLPSAQDILVHRLALRRTPSEHRNKPGTIQLWSSFNYNVAPYPVEASAYTDLLLGTGEVPRGLDFPIHNVDLLHLGRHSRPVPYREAISPNFGIDRVPVNDSDRAERLIRKLDNTYTDPEWATEAQIHRYLTQERDVFTYGQLLPLEAFEEDPLLEDDESISGFHTREFLEQAIEEFIERDPRFTYEHFVREFPVNFYGEEGPIVFYHRVLWDESYLSSLLSKNDLSGS